jgi:predicted O-linked N-acetylglucosamine transferase (SPINDLY family)
MAAAAPSSEEYSAVLRRDPHNVDALFRFAQFSCRQGDFDGAIHLLDRAIAIDDRQGRLHNLKGMALNALDRPTEALENFEGAIRRQPDLAFAYANHGDALAALGRLDEAVASYDRALELVPNSPENLTNRGAAFFELGRYEEALASYRAAARLNANSAGLHLSIANASTRLGRPHDALASFEKALAIEPSRVETLLGRAGVLVDLAIYDEALQTLEAVLARDPNNLEALNGKAYVLQILGRAEEALGICNRVLAINPRHGAALLNRGSVLCALRRHEDGLGSYRAALLIQPGNVEAHYGVGYSLAALNQFEEALASYDRVVATRPDHLDASNGRGNALRALKRFDEALASFEAILRVNPRHADAIANKGGVLFALRRSDEALAAYDEALAIRPDHVASHVGRGVVLLDRGLLDQSRACFERALALDPDDLAALENRAIVLAASGARDNAIAIRKRALVIDPDDGHAYSALLFSHLAACEWTELSALTIDFEDRLARGRSVLEPFAVLEYSGDPEDQLQCAKTFVAVRFPQAAPRRTPAGRPSGRPIRLAYLSPDFRRHPVAHAIVSLLESHDRSRFEVIGASYGRDDGSDIRMRIVRAVDRFCDLSAMNDTEAAQYLRGLDVDVAIDLAGYTEQSRPGILAQRPAAVQVSYLGYSATTGADFIDYVIADEVVLPPSEQAFFTEKVALLADCFLPADGKRPVVGTAPTRRSAGLPDNGFVFCSFNNSWKIRPPVFDVWMRLLGNVPRSVLWLSQGEEIALTNLRRHAEARGIDPGRLIFAPKVPSAAEHFARHQLADLFLDTYPYNAHSTAADALWCGLPVLTCSGRTFASRVAASALTAVGLPELMTHDLAQYERMAMRLAQECALLEELRRKLALNRTTCALFDSDRFRRHIELAYFEMLEIWHRGEVPRSFRVTPVEQLRAMQPPQAAR